MLNGEQVVLRALRRDELATAYEWEQDLETWLLAKVKPYEPTSYERFVEAVERVPEQSSVSFGIEVDGRLVGTGSLWGIDQHNRRAHVGLTIGDRAHRGQGLGRDALAVLTDYGFRLRGLHRLQLETLDSNEAMLRAARSVGYREEGRLRGNAFVAGQFVDEVVLGLLADEWHGRAE